MNIEQTSNHWLTVEDYLAGEDSRDIRHEYIGGQIYAMLGNNVPHNRIAGNTVVMLHQAARDKHCELFMSDVKLRLNVSGDDVFYYPDLMVCCDAADDRTKPCLLVEILSDSTERIDRREKRFAYTQIESLQGYLLLAQNELQATLCRRANHWQAENYNDAEQNIDLPCVDKAFMLSEIYEGL